MPRTKTLSLLNLGECFATDDDTEDGGTDLVGAVLRAALAYRVVATADDFVDTVSATGESRRWSARTEVTPIARMGFDRLCEHHRRAIDNLEQDG